MSLFSRFKKDFQKQSEVHIDKKEFLERAGIESSGKAKTYHNTAKRLAIIIPASILGFIALFPLVVLLVASIKIEEDEKSLRYAYRSVTAKRVEEETFRSLNGIVYEENDYLFSPVAEEYRDNVNRFAYSLSQGIDLSLNSTIYSPLSFFLINDLLSHAGDEEAQEIFEGALGKRDVNEDNFAPMLRTNFFKNQTGSTKIYNGAFFRNDQNVREGYLDFLTSRNVEAFKASFLTDKGKIADWANERIDEKLIGEAELPTTEDTVLLLLSLLYFKASWATPFAKEDSFKGDFHCIDGQTKEVNFMRHEVSCYPTAVTPIAPYKGVYKYDGYYSCYDRYKNGYSIQYLTPEKESDDIFALLNGVNYLEEEESHYYSNELLKTNTFALEFIVPTFRLNTSLDMGEALKGAGLAKLFKPEDPTEIHHVLANAIDSEEERQFGSYIELAKQYASVQFDEDGTTVRSIAFQSMAAGSAAPGNGKFIVRLDQPFVYVIRDENGLPLFIGSYVK